MKEFLAALDSLVKRGLAASLTFFSLLFVTEWVIGTISAGDTTSLLSYWGSWSSTNLPSPHSAWVAVLAVVFLVVGLSYTLSAINEIIYDNTLRENFAPMTLLERTPFNSSMAKNLVSLRKAVERKVRDEVPQVELAHYTDYSLYEVVGGIVETDTSGYVDVAKAIGVVFVSVMLVGAVEIVIHRHALSWWIIGLLVMATFLVYLGGREAIKTHYRSRAIRLYINFLMMPSETVQRKLGQKEAAQPSDDAETAPEPAGRGGDRSAASDTSPVRT